MNVLRPRIRSIHFNRFEQPVRATVWTRFGWVRVKWKCVTGHRRWTAFGSPSSKWEAIPAIEHIEQIGMTMG